MNNVGRGMPISLDTSCKVRKSQAANKRGNVVVWVKDMNCEVLTAMKRQASVRTRGCDEACITSLGAMRPR